MKKIKKILVTGMTSNLGGVEKFIITYCKKIICDNVKIDFIITDDTCVLQDQIEEMNARIYKIQQNHFKHHIKFKKEFENYLKDGKYDAIWVNDCSLNSFHYIKLAKKIGIKTRIIHSHNSKNMDMSFKGKLRYIAHLINKIKVGKYATHYWACSKLAAHFFYNKRLIDKVKIINNGIDVEKYKFNPNIREKYREGLGVQKNYVIGHAGRFHFQKNHKFLLDVFEKYSKQNSNAKLVLVGDGEEKENIKRYIKDNNLDEKVILLGVRDDVENIMQAMDVFLLPSVFEGFPIVGVEAQCSGLPCIFSDKITTEVKINENTFFLPIENQSYANWIHKLDELSSVEVNRENADKIVTDRGYNINHEAIKIRKFFEEIGE